MKKEAGAEPAEGPQDDATFCLITLVNEHEATMLCMRLKSDKWRVTFPGMIVAVGVPGFPQVRGFRVMVNASGAEAASEILENVCLKQR